MTTHPLFPAALAAAVLSALGARSPSPALALASQRVPAPAPPRRPAADWPQFRGPGGQGISADRNVPATWSPTAGVKWKTALPGPGTSSPIVLGDRVYLTCFTGFGAPGQTGGSPEQLRRHLLCLDRGTGKLLWNTEVPARGAVEPTIRENHGYASSTPAADSERIYASFGTAGVFAFDHGGRRLWQADIGSRISGWGTANSPVLFENLVIVNASVESESLVALDRRTGKEVWRLGGIRESWNTPVLVSLPDGRTELAVAIFGKVLGIAPRTGELLWSCSTDIRWYMVPSLVAKAGVIYCIGGRTGGSLAVRAGGRGDVTQSHRLWTATRGSNVPSPVLHDGHLYWARETPGVALCAEAATGKLIYEERLEGAGQVYASPVLADGKLYYIGRGGRAYVVRAAPKFEVLATNTLGDSGTFNASPAVAGGRLFLRSDRFLYCIGSE